MARFDVYQNANRATARDVPLLLDVQHDLFERLGTRMVIPLFTEKAVKKPMTRLNPTFEVAGMRVVLMTPEMAGVPSAVLGPRVGSLAGESAAILGAVDFLLTGG